MGVCDAYIPDERRILERFRIYLKKINSMPFCFVSGVWVNIIDKQNVEAALVSILYNKALPVVSQNV